MGGKLTRSYHSSEQRKPLTNYADVAARPTRLLPLEQLIIPFRLDRCSPSVDGSLALSGFVGYLPNGLPDYRFRTFQERLELVERLRRQIAETGSDGPENFQASHEDRE